MLHREEPDAGSLRRPAFYTVRRAYRHPLTARGRIPSQMRAHAHGKDVKIMGHTPYGYRIENGKAVIDEKKAQQIRNLYRNYLDGMALAKAAHEAGIET